MIYYTVLFVYYGRFRMRSDALFTGERVPPLFATYVAKALSGRATFFCCF